MSQIFELGFKFKLPAIYKIYKIYTQKESHKNRILSAILYFTAKFYEYLTKNVVEDTNV